MFTLQLTADLGYTIEQLVDQALIIADRVGLDVEFTHKRVDVYVFRGESASSVLKAFYCIYNSRGEQQ